MPTRKGFTCGILRDTAVELGQLWLRPHTGLMHVFDAINEAQYQFKVASGKESCSIWPSTRSLRPYEQRAGRGRGVSAEVFLGFFCATAPKFSKELYFCRDERCMYTRHFVGAGTQIGLRLFLVACHMTSVIACFHGHGCQRETKYLI